MYDATAENIANDINEILDNEEKRKYITDGCKLTKKLLGTSHCVQRVAEIIKDELIKEESKG
jgi:lipid A disaccharide synthetase